MSRPVSKYALPDNKVRVYDWNQKPGLGTQPKGIMDRADADEAVRRNYAIRCVKGFAIQMKPDPQQRFQKWLSLVIRGTSCQMGPRVTEQAAFGEEHLSELAKEAAASYLMIFAGSYCPLILREA